MRYTDEALIATLESLGVPWDKHFALSSGLVGYLDSDGRLCAHIIEDDALNLATCAFLIKHGKVHAVEPVAKEKVVSNPSLQPTAFGGV